MFVSAVQNVNEVISEAKGEMRGCVLMCCLSGGSRRWGQSGVSTDFCPGTEDFYRLEKIKRITENTLVRKGGNEFTGSRL